MGTDRMENQKWVTEQICFVYVTRIPCIGCKYGSESPNIHHCEELECQCKNVNNLELFPAFAFNFTSIISISVPFSLLLLSFAILTPANRLSKILPLHVTVCPKRLSLVFGAGPKEGHALLHISSGNRHTQASYRTGLQSTASSLLPNNDSWLSF